MTDETAVKCDGGMNHDDTADAIRYFLNRYRAEVLGEPVAFEEVGRPNRYTFVDDVGGVRPDVPDLFDGDWHDVGFDWFKDGDVDVTIDGKRIGDDISSLDLVVESNLNRIQESVERDASGRLEDAAETTVTAVDRPVRVSDMRDALHAIRNYGYASDALYTHGKPQDYADHDGGAAFFVGADVEDDLASQAVSITHGDADPRDFGFDTGLPSIDGFPVTASSHIDAAKAVVVDVGAIAPPPVPTADVPFVVRDGCGIAVVEKIDTDFVWGDDR